MITLPLELAATSVPAHPARLRRVNEAELWLLAAALSVDVAALPPPARGRKPGAEILAIARHSEN